MIASKSYGFIVVCKLLCVVDKKNPDFIEALFKITAHNIPVTMIATTVTEIYFLSMIVAWVNDTPLVVSARLLNACYVDLSIGWTEDVFFALAVRISLEYSLQHIE